jgi:hypothetical protein
MKVSVEWLALLFRILEVSCSDFKRLNKMFKKKQMNNFLMYFETIQ